VHPDGVKTAIQIETDSDRALRIVELLKAHHCTVRAISGGDYLKLCDEVDE
jgi:hypothetical protein